MSKFKKAEKAQTKLRLALTGPAGSGKTYSALQIAFGLGGKIGLICTEHGSGALYSDLGEYDIAELEAPFTVEKYIETIKEAEKEYDTIIIDSLSHAWAGEGGLLDQHEKLVSSSKTGNSYTAWSKITPLHNQLIETILSCKSHIIATMRTKTEYTLTDENGKKVPKKIGTAPIQRDGMDFEFTTVFDMSIEHIATSTKDRTNMFGIGNPFTPSIETGKIILTWLNTGMTPLERYNKLPDEILQGFDVIDPDIDIDRRIDYCSALKWNNDRIMSAINKKKESMNQTNTNEADNENINN